MAVCASRGQRASVFIPGRSVPDVGAGQDKAEESAGMVAPKDDSAVQGGRPMQTAQGFMQQGTGRIDMKWLKKWSYLAMLLGMGLIYLTCVDGWQVYAEPLREAKLRYDNWYKDAYPADGSAMEGEGTAPGSGSGNAASDGALEGSDAASAPSGDHRGDGEADGQGTPSGSGNEALPPTGGQDGENGSGSPEGEHVPGEPGSLPEGDAPGEPGEGQAGTPDGESQEPSQEDGGESPSSGPGEAAYMTVEDDYFADAVFIGDSRTMGLFEYGGLEDTAAFYASTGLTVYEMFEAEIVPGEDGKITVEEALQQNSFAKIYLMIGINEMGTGTVESFLEAYEAAVAHLRELQPDAIIYLQAIIKVTTERSEQGDYINNEGIIARNEGIARLADNEHVFFLDVNPLICDETGGMIPDYTFDGVHLKAVYIDIWKDFLKTHAVSLP